ncbi:MAG TPA: tetratricopeptide repeat protein [Anaeromyxobacteraceae bacterium]|nr:tetratricopeptide repeat protein [Anaeromyxobacteraceae bacterium]
MTGLALSLLLASANPCAPVEPAHLPDRAAASAYRAVAASELSAGSVETAIAAYREAAASDPADGEAREALRRLCQSPPPPDPFREGIRLMDAGEYRAAAAAFGGARSGDAGPSAVLLQGICLFELGEDEEARSLFQEVAAYPPHRDEARMYLGLVALRAGAGAEAGALFESAAASPALERTARDLARLARREGRLVLSAFAESGWDSNVNLAPGGTPSGPPRSDGLYAFSLNALFRPQGTSGPYLRAGGFLQDQVQLGAYDFGGFDAAAGWQLGGSGRGLLLEYDYGSRRFGGSSYLSAHRLLGTGWLRAGPTLLGASYLVRRETYAPTWSSFSGKLQRAEVRASLLATPGLRIGLAYGAGRDAARDPALSWLEHGPRAELRIAAGRALLGLDASVTWRPYDSYDPALSARRSDTYLDGAAFAEWDLDGRLSFRVSLLGRRALSNVPAFSYDKLLPTVGIGYAIGLSP